MKQSKILVNLLFLALLSLSGIFDHQLWTPDEPRDAEISREILQGRSWAIPTLNLQPHLEKPPLYFWSVASAYKIFGVHAWSARLPSVLFACVILLGFLVVLGAAIYIQNWRGLVIAVGLVVFGSYWIRRGQNLPQALAISTASFAVVAIFILFPYLDGIKSLAPFCRGLPAMDPIPAYLPDETTQAVIPFYTGHYVRAIKNYSEAQEASTHRPAYIVVVRKQESKTYIEDLRAWYPYVWVGDESKGGRTMVLLANVPK